jgi:DNA mismatch repair protein MutS
MLTVFIMANKAKTTPMMAQYRRIKGELPKEALLFFRLGDFYEMFFEDACEGAQILNVALTKRGVTPMCGIPYHAANSYISKLLKAGRKVAICDQVEEAQPGKLVKREVTQILSPGTHFDERLLVDERNNFLGALYSLEATFGLAVVDLTTGDFKLTELDSEKALISELERLKPAEIILPAEASNLWKLLHNHFSNLSKYDDWLFEPETAQFTLRDHFKVASLDGYGLKHKPASIGAAGAVLSYLTQQLRRDVSHLTRISFYQATDYLVLDTISLRNLEILEPLQRGAPSKTCLYGAINRTVTPMGARRLRDWLTQPLATKEAIVRRQETVQTFLDYPEALEEFRGYLKDIRDLERTISRISVGAGNARDLLTLKLALEQIPVLRRCLQTISKQSIARTDTLNKEVFADTNTKSTVSPSRLDALTEQLTETPELVDLISRAIVTEPPLTLKEGGLIQAGFDQALDELHQAATAGKQWIAALQKEEIEKTNIPSLKVRFNSVFGYFIEVTKTHLDKVPEHYTRKQTIANGERFITAELKEMEGKILGAEERSAKLEYELFLKIRDRVLEHVPLIQSCASALAQLDVLSSFAELAQSQAYCRPLIEDEGQLMIKEGRHPVLDQTLTEERFIPNDSLLDELNIQIALITGPNMAGKSTFIRQVALLTALAHTGSFIPATEARIDLVDRIFTRIGASDDLSRGQSTFMVEMSETANILNNATSKSLVVLDEIGRGTSTFDGLSLAWSIVEFLHNKIGAKTYFATHYHELTELAARLPRLSNYNVVVREWNDQVIFLHKIVAGGTDKSYGIQVARLAGVPKEVVQRAKTILNNLEETELTPEGRPRRVSRHRTEREKLRKLEPSAQLDLFAL